MPHCHVNHSLYHTTEDTAILTSTCINIGPSLLMQGLKTSLLYTKEVLQL